MWLTLACILLALIAYPVHSAWRAIQGMYTSLRPYHMAYAMHNYHDTHRQLPPAVIYDDNGDPMHSWRVLILPFIEESRCYEGYDLQQPWNSPANDARCRATTIAKRLFASTEAWNTDQHCTNFVVIRGPGTMFEDGKALNFKDLEEPSETVMLVEIPASDIAWHEPRDLDIRTMSFQLNDPTKPCVGNARGNGANVAFADCSIVQLKNSTTPEELRAMITIADDGDARPND